MSGFFEIPKKKTTVRGMTCVSCGLYNTSKTPRMEPYGKYQKRILCIGEANSAQSDQKGIPWQDAQGQLVQNVFRKLGYNLFEDCLCINSIQCHPVDADGKDRAPTSYEVGCCRSRVSEIIKKHKPHLILLFGTSAVESVYGLRWQKDLGTINKWRGWTIPDRELNAWVCPVFHPHIFNPEKERKEVETVWTQDLARALGCVRKSLPEWTDETKQVEIVDDLSFLADLKGLTAFDVETTGLKGHDRTKHKIICMSVCNREDKSYSFMIPKDEKQLRHIKRFLRSDIPKLAQNFKFEQAWCKVFFNVEVQNWKWDSMLAAHLLDNRPDITGLKFQALIKFGIDDYNSEVQPYLEAKDNKNGNAVNEIEKLVATEEGKKKLLIYCGIDSLLELRLGNRQRKEMGME